MTVDEYRKSISDINNSISDLKDKKKSIIKEFINSNKTVNIGDYVSVTFIFLQFPDDPLQVVQGSQAAADGSVSYFQDLQKRMNFFTEKNNMNKAGMIGVNYRITKY